MTDHIPTPDFLQCFLDGKPWFDPYPLNGNGPIEPPEGAKVWVNPGFSRKAEAWENALRWKRGGHQVVCYLPVESSTDLGFKIAKAEQNGEIERLTFHRRPYPGCRDIEILILVAKPEAHDR